MKVKILAYHAVASWTWDLPDDSDTTCGICGFDFEATCSKCKFPGEDCPIIMGACKHNFHLHCLDQWLQQASSQGTCPMCRQTFKQKVAETGLPQLETPAPAQRPVSRAVAVIDMQRNAEQTPQNQQQTPRTAQRTPAMVT